MTPETDGTQQAGAQAVSRTHALLDTARAYADPLVDIAAVAAITAVVYAGPGDGLAQVAVGGIASVALGKRYLAGKLGGKP